MKKILLALMGIVALTLASCSSDSSNDGGIQNFWTLTKENKTLYDDDTEGVKVTVTLAYTATENITLTPVMSSENETVLDAFEFSQPTITIAKGEKSATFLVRATGKKMLSTTQTLAISFQDVSGLRKGEVLSITAEPNIDVEITEEQKELAEYWMNTLGFDVRPFLGQLAVNTTITLSDDDKTEQGYEENSLIYNKDFSAITISDKATKDNIVLKMTVNPMGMQAFIQEAFGITTPYFEGYPIYDALVALMGTPDPSTLKVVLDNIVVDPITQTLDFTATTEDEVTLVPFTYDFPAWNTLLQKAGNGEEIEVNEGETTVSYPLSDVLDQDGTFNPAHYLGNTNIASDEYYHEPSNFIEPTASYDLENNTITFNFAWDFGAGSLLYDYVKINAIYTLNSRK